jgi:biotin carboxyl carrier protein
MAGTFYRAPTPDDPPFVEVGDTVTEGDTVALIEVMKLFTELKAEVAGKVAQVDVPDSKLVDFGRALVWIEPA